MFDNRRTERGGNIWTKMTTNRLRETRDGCRARAVCILHPFFARAQNPIPGRPETHGGGLILLPYSPPCAGIRMGNGCLPIFSHKGPQNVVESNRGFRQPPVRFLYWIATRPAYGAFLGLIPFVWCVHGGTCLHAQAWRTYVRHADTCTGAHGHTHRHMPVRV